MPTFEVTYVDSVLRAAVVEAGPAEEAETLVREQIECRRCHHAVDVSNSDWQAEPHTPQPHRNCRGFDPGRN